MRSRLALVALASTALSCNLLPRPLVPPKYEVPAGPRKLNQVSPDERIQYLRRAQAWQPVDTASLDLLAGPEGSRAFAFDAEVTCDYDPARSGTGLTPKFLCRLPGGDTVKVKYGESNGEVYGEVAASRLLWALGFGSDAYYPVHVICRGCPENPSKHGPAEPGAERRFDMAIIERNAAGETIEVQNSIGGWAWWELPYVDEAQGGSPRAHVDALRLLAAFIQHGDNKDQQQRLVCPPGEVKDHPDGSQTCGTPRLVISDLGSTFARVDLANRNKVRFDDWSTVPIWKDAARCQAQLKRSLTGTVGHPEISEAGRAFLAERLSALSEKQIEDIFRAARVERRREQVERGGVKRPVTTADWTAAFLKKRDEIARARCPR